MRFRDLVSLIFNNLGRRKGRVALTAVGVVIGTAAVVVLVSLGIGLQANFTSQLYGIGDLSRIEVYPGYKSSGGGGGGMMVMGGEATEMLMLTPKAIEQIASIPNVVQVIPTDYMYSGGEMEFGRLRGYANIMGIDVTDLADMGIKADQGSTELARGTVVVGSWVAQNFYDPSLRPGQDPPAPPDLMGESIRFVMYKYTSDGQQIRKVVTMRVAGVLAETRGEEDGTIYVSMSQLDQWNQWSNGARINRDKQGYNRVIVRVTDAESSTDVVDAINELGYQAYTPQEYLQGINGFFTIMQLIFGGVGAIALLVAAIGIANTMTMAILERTKEIGLMKAIGATNRDVLSIFLGEAAGIGLIGGLGGVILGWGGGQLLNVVAVTYLSQQAASTGGAPPTTAVVTPIWLPVSALVFATIIGLLSGLYPSLRAATMVPVIALKYE